ncbi:MAG TPA: asparagine synthase (glutamine-hydrolyzing) [Myxococcota bacterium]|nr:asparagine synthase (glutamine-hydrolyzing) [Myxococcota bacterium]
MCGIAGIVSRDSANPDAVRAMCDVQAHRGPDGEGFWLSADGHCALGHRRLAIIDLSEGGRQPMVDAERQLAISYNGEIYNFVEVRKRLEGLGHRFRTQSDTEVLLEAYKAWGSECLRELNGMFAFALWDGARRILFCARDRFGEKPFHYAHTGDTFAFASEVKALALLEGVDLAVDEGVLAAYAEDGSTRIDASERTLVRGVHQLLPAHALEVRIDADDVRIVRSWCYWSADVTGRAGYGERDVRSAARDLIELLTDSVRLRLRSDVPVGSCLSGGLDSSTVVSLMRRLEPQADLRTFTGRFPGDSLDEGDYAHLVVEASRTRPFEVAPTPARFLDEADAVYWHAEFPIGGFSQFAQWCVFHLASRNGVVVLLDGQGSDEVLGGYGNMIVMQFLAQLRAQHRWRAWLHERSAAARSNPALFSWSRIALATNALAPLRSAMRRATGRPQLTRSDLYRREWLASARPDRPEPAREEEVDDRHAVSRILWTLSFRTMLSSLLRFGDRLSMAHSREVRLPFCDHRIAEFAFALPPDLLVGDGQVKRVLRCAIQGLVPDRIVTRPKQGFIPPQERWLVGPLREWILDLVHEPGPIGDLLGPTMRSVAADDESMRAREVVCLWELANLLAWSRYSLARMRASRRVRASLPGRADAARRLASAALR